ncbi:helix-turn-helix transcriptional regulator [Rheinheimera sp. MMS21-TC3]|uniref:helix-turn-helix domain-containing protein n=1 Tax=Rheinheimera sp. MMS21-TC3 TaxID=3072790 RepID=UPI0028C40867|nr:helix-turn-helix transcriptional regulator [Rheinheimera sp. MMS21-TC3]WNO60860.1 helix-turn-helix transcriptional regulator [Rheinheimera sp. MMS21-TC3]
MTIQKTVLQSELLQTFDFYTDQFKSSALSQNKTVNFYHHVSADRSTPVQSVSLDDVLAELMQDSEMAGLFSEANKQIAETYYKDEKSLRAMRLQKGITQGQLAEAIGTSQPQIYKLENGDNDTRSSTVIKLAKYFDLPPGEMFEILNGDGNEA